jgi:hypothetical protein
MIGRLEAIEEAVRGIRANQKGVERELGKIVSRLAHLGPSFDVAVDERFLTVARPLVSTQRTMLDYDRLFSLWQAAGNVAHLALPAVEIGTFRGGSAAFIAEALRTFAGEDCELHVVDTFEGHLEESFTEHDEVDRQRGKFQDTSAAEVRGFLATVSPRIQVYEGDASTVLPAWPERKYSLVHLDVDLYQPMIDCLEYFGSRMPAGGVIVVDDYETPTCPGVAQAVAEFLGRTTAFQTWRLQGEQLILNRR